MGAIVHRLRLDPLDAARLVKELKRKHMQIGDHFRSGAGCWLQRLDSDMAERVQLGLLRQGVPVLPIHDSFVVPARYQDAAREQMVEAFDTVISTERSVSRLTKLDQQLKPKTTYTMVRRSLPLFSPLPRSVPLSAVVPSPRPFYSGVSAFFNTGRRITPLGRIAAIDAKRRRCIPQEGLASLIGISGPTLANILAGRFGTSQQTAERIAEVIASTPAFERQPFLPGLAV